MKLNFKIKLILLSSLIGVLVLLMIIAPFVGKSASVSRQDNQLLFGKVFKSTLANEISLSKGDNDVRLIKQNDTWFVSYGDELVEANTEQVNAFLEAFKTLKQGRLVEKKAKDLEAYGLTSSEAIKIEISDSKSRSFVLLVGKENETYSKQYYQLENSEGVSETVIPYSFTQVANKEWANLDLFKGITDASNIISIKVKGKSPLEESKNLLLDYQLDRLTDSEGKEMWTLAGKEEKVDENEVQSIARAIVSATAYDYCFALSAAEFGIENPVLSFQITGTDGKIRSLAIGKQVPNNERFYASLVEEKRIVEIPKSTLNGLITPLEDLIKNE